MDKILDLKFFSSDLREDMTIREFLQRLLLTLFEEQDGFSGKRPFGNSCWDGDIIVCLIQNKIISGKVDGDNYLEDYKYDEYWKVISEAIKSL